MSCQYHSIKPVACLKDSIYADVFGSTPSQSAALPGSDVQTGEMYPKGMQGVSTSPQDGKKQDESAFLSRGFIRFTLWALFAKADREKLLLSPSTSAPAASIFLAK